MVRALVIVEGADLEPRFFTRLAESCGMRLKIVSLRTNVYRLYCKLRDYGFDYSVRVALRELLGRECPELEEDFAYTYLVFDCDAQNRGRVRQGDPEPTLPEIVEANAARLQEMAEYFNDETDPDRGKLYVNYPMMESYRDCDSPFDASYAAAEVTFAELLDYKARVGRRKFASRRIDGLSRADFDLLMRQQVFKLSVLYGGGWAAPSYADYCQMSRQASVLDRQQAMFASGKMSVLNTSLFLPIDYFGDERLYRQIAGVERRPVFDLSFPGTAVVTDDGRSVSYAELRRMSDAWAAKMPPRSLAFLLVGNHLESLVSYVGCLNHGIVPLMLSENIDAALLEELKQRYRPDFVFRNGVRVDRAENPHGRARLHPDLALLLTTSGSTGSPKLVRQSYRNVEANRDSIVRYLKLDASERPITTLPMNYTYGLSIINSHLAVGATVLLTDRTLVQREFWTFFNEQRATSFGGVPYTYEMLDKLMFFRRQLPSLRTMTQAGGKILPALHRKFAEWAAKEGKRFVVMYGQAEATARMSYLPPERSLEKVGSMGVAIPGGRFEIEDGELVYYGDNVTLGYAECEADLAKGDERHGKLMTGDMARVDEDGFYYIVGRKKRFLKIFGNRVNLDETERLIKGAFPEIDCACGGVDDKMRVFIARLGDCSIAGMAQKVQTFVAEKTHLNFKAFEVVEIDKIPKNESGKTLYKELPE